MAQVSEFKIGDIVRLTKGEPDTPGYESWVREVALESDGTAVCNWLLRFYEEHGWAVELISRPQPSLPTKPNALGWATYLGERRLVRRDAYRGWSTYATNGNTYSVVDDDLSDFEEAALIPKELADRIVEADESAMVSVLAAERLLSELAEHLKGQDDE